MAGTAMTAVVWTLLAVILGALVTFGVEIRRSIGALDAKVDARIGALDAKVDARIGALDAKVDARIGALDRKVDARCDALDRKVDAVDAELRIEMGRVVRTQERMAGSLDVLVRMAHTHRGPGEGGGSAATPSPA